MSTLKALNITKQYPGITALDDVSVSFDSGKIHAFIGKNGSGKSTLLKIIAGAETPTEGTIVLDDEQMRYKSPQDALDKGIATIYQEFSLVPSLSVAENIYMGRLPMRGRFVDWKRLYADTEALLKDLGVDIPAKALVQDLTVWQSQMVEIAKAMSNNPKVLQLDEPTSALANDETETLFEMIRKLREKDVIIIYVTHRLHELWRIADTCTVLRDGKYIGTEPLKDLSREKMLQMMFGDVKVRKRPDDIPVQDEVLMEVKNLSLNRYFDNVSFKLHKGEVLGIAGMLGSGRTELLNAIFGSGPLDSGEIIIDGEYVTRPAINKMKAHGMALTPENRKTEGLVQCLSVAENLCSASLRNSPGEFVSKSEERNKVEKQISDLMIKVSDVRAPVSSLSGGNQQKVILGNWLNTAPKLLLLDEPSRGIDVNAKQQIFEIVWQQARQGCSSIIVSSELEELLETCHRILIIRQGRLCGEIYPEQVNVEQLYSLCMKGMDP